MDNKQCNHKGKFSGVGQTSISMSNRIIVVPSIVCGACGNVTSQIKFIDLKPQAVKKLTKKRK